jgi:D-alanine-D-alanine ligase-like ATP-grasp enzyme
VGRRSRNRDFGVWSDLLLEITSGRRTQSEPEQHNGMRTSHLKTANQLWLAPVAWLRLGWMVGRLGRLRSLGQRVPTFGWSDAGQTLVRRSSDAFFTQNVTVVFAVYVRNTQAMRHLSSYLLRNGPYVNVGARGSANSLDSERTKDVRKQICGGLA